ncbi:hypothetical protein OR16_28069 [Cupriavidus basilensis OR16]|uniref:Uncharacterized protein n=1 Tax=Cupriavidus basilensis OR16 TaxID=1127483 RepID=H1SBP8_9BURK|nr:hypothetical protein OR16_28069 [Cupriavidus basilensis OR16]
MAFAVQAEATAGHAAATHVAQRLLPAVQDRSRQPGPPAKAMICINTALAQAYKLEALQAVTPIL